MTEYRVMFVQIFEDPQTALPLGDSIIAIQQQAITLLQDAEAAYAYFYDFNANPTAYPEEPDQHSIRKLKDEGTLTYVQSGGNEVTVPLGEAPRRLDADEEAWTDEDGETYQEL